MASQIALRHGLYDVAAAAKYLDYAEESVRRAARRGDLVGEKVGASWVFERSRLDEYRRRWLVGRSKHHPQSHAFDAS